MKQKKSIDMYLHCVLKVRGTIYSLGLMGHTYDTLSGVSINTEAVENKANTYIVKEGDKAAKIMVSSSCI